MRTQPSRHLDFCLIIIWGGKKNPNNKNSLTEPELWMYVKKEENGGEEGRKKEESKEREKVKKKKAKHKKHTKKQKQKQIMALAIT